MGLNPNSHQVRAESQVDIRVWHRSQSKKKGKKRNLVASASHSLGELLKRQDKEPCSSEWAGSFGLAPPILPDISSSLVITEVEIRLQCQNPSSKATSSRGKPQNGATLLLRIHPPAGVVNVFGEDLEDEQGPVSESTARSESCELW